MNRRRLLQGGLAIAGIGPVGLAAAQETPAVIPAPTEVPLATVAPELSYDALVAHGQELGRQATDLLAAGEAEALFERFSPELQAEMSADQIEATLRDFTTDRVHFEESNAHLIFDGRVTGNAMSGVLQSSALAPFSLRRSDATPEPAPVAGTPFPTEMLAGHWTGAATMADGTSIGLMVDFAADGQTGTLSIRDRNVVDSPLSGIAFNTQQPLGERTSDWLMPHSPDRQSYGANFDWGGRGLSVSTPFDENNQISSLQLAEEWMLAPDPAADEPPLPPLRLPFDGVWWVVSGGETVEDSGHATNREQRHAVDLLIWRNGSTFQGDGVLNEDYYAWGSRCWRRSMQRWWRLSTATRPTRPANSRSMCQMRWAIMWCCKPATTPSFCWRICRKPRYRSRRAIVLPPERCWDWWETRAARPNRICISMRRPTPPCARGRLGCR